ncbi:AMP-binding protein [Lujinxingia litoralis]|uniref:AMP-binding protein n=1 Tax=Lujinxingia litoralis TaxID=2211119 RepID=UPI001314655D|nr:class I adenylate-forming enzyme family protein [Lujinxingia litoralis]
MAKRNLPTELWKRFQNDAIKEAPARALLDEAGRLQETTYWEWTRQVQRLAMGLVDWGLEPGARIGCVAPNSAALLDIMVAGWLAGACLVPLLPGQERSDSLRQLARSGCTLIVVADESERQRLQGPGGQLPSELRFLLLEGSADSPSTLSLEALSEQGRSRLRRGGLNLLAERMFERPAHAPALILFDPTPSPDSRGALFDGERVLLLLERLAHQMALTSEAPVRLGALLSYGWPGAFLLTMATLYAGQQVAVAPSPRALHEQIAALKPTHLICGPAFLESLASRWQERVERAPELLKQLADHARDPSPLSRALGGIGEKAAERLLYQPVRSELGGRLRTIYVPEGQANLTWREILQRAGVKILGYFALPETGISHLEHPDATRPGSAGRPIEGIATRHANARGGEIDELWLRGDTLFEDYWSGTGPRTINDQGWLPTDRRARLESGFIFLEPEA